MSDNGAVFQELIGIEFDTQDFSQSLDQLVSIYEQKIEEMSSKGLNVSDAINVGGLSELKAELNSVVDTVKALADAFTEQFANMGGAVSDAAAHTQELQQAIKDTDDAAEESGKKQSDGLTQRYMKMKQLEQQQQADQAAQYDFMAKRQIQAIQDDLKRTQSAEDERQSILEKSSNAQLKYSAGADANGVPYGQDPQVALIQQKRDVDLATIRGKNLQADQAAAEEANVQQIAMNEEFIAIMQKRDLDLAGMRGKRLSDDIAAAEEANQAQIRLNQQFIEIMQKRDVELAVIRGKEMAATARSNAQAASSAQSGGVIGSFKSGFFGNEGFSVAGMAEMLGQVTRFQVLWGAVGLAMQAAMVPVNAIVEGFKDGFNYLNQLEEKSYELSGVLDANVRFSSDLRENFQLSSQAATQVVKALQDVAVSTGLKPENLQRSFSALTESGGAGTVKNMQELVQLTELFNLAIRASGASIETSRTLISQIPQAMAGNLPPTSKWLEVLHMTSDEWKNMVTLGLQHHDLLDRLQPAMQPYLDATSQAALNEQQLSEKVDLLKTRLEAAFAAPWQEGYKKFLESVVDLLGDVETKTDKVARANANAGDAKNHPWWMTLLGASSALVPGGGSAFPSETGAATPDPASVLTQAISAKNPPASKPNGDALAELQKQYSDDLKKIKDDTRVTFSDIDEQERSHSISVEDATNQRINALTRERVAIDALVASIQKKLLLTSGKAASKSKFGGTLTTELTDAASEEQVGFNKASGQAEADQNSVDESALRAAMTRARTQADFEISEAKRSGANHVSIVEMELAADQKQYDLEKQLLDKLSTDAGANAKAQQDVQNQKDALDQKISNNTIARSHEMASATIADLTKQLDDESQVDMAKVHADEQSLARAQKMGASDDDLKNRRKSLNAEYVTTLNNQMAQLSSIISLAEALGVEGSEVDKLKKKYETLNAEKDKAITNNTTSNRTPLFGDQAGPTGQAGNDFQRQIDDWKGGAKTFGDAVNVLNSGFKFFSTAATSLVDAFKRGSENGGLLGGIGGVTSQVGNIASGISDGLSSFGGALGSIGAAAGPVGGILSIAGGLFSMIGGLFTAAAQHIAEQIKKSVDQIMASYSAGDQTLSATITALEQQRQDAITRLSGKKGGKDQLNNLLPQIDQQIASLKLQQKSIITSFEQSLSQMQLQNSVLGTTLKTWQDINKQVKDYLDAGGDVAKAQQFLSLQLQSMKQDALDNLNQADQTAIGDAIQLNSLLQQKIDLQKQWNNTQFSLLAADSLERRGSQAITAGTQIQQQKAQFDQQMSDLDNQISLTTQKVTLEGKIFDINKSVADLQKDANALQIASLNEQLDKVKAYAQVYQGIFQNAAGVFQMTAALSGALNAGPSSLPVTININGTGGVDPAVVADQLSNELKTRGRFGLGREFVRQF